MKFLALCLGLLCLSGRRVQAQDLIDPAAVLRKCREAYAGCATCTAEGKYHSVYRAGSQTNAKDVRILFARTDHLFRLDWTDTAQGGKITTESIFTRHGDTFFYWGALDRFERSADLTTALGAEAGISSGLTSFLPRLLRGESSPLNLKTPVLRAEETIGGSPCYVVAGESHRGGTMEVAIDKGDFAIRRERQHYTVGPVTRQQAIGALKKIDPDMAAKLAAEPTPPAFDVDESTDYTKTSFGTPVTADACDYPVPEGMPLQKD